MKTIILFFLMIFSFIPVSSMALEKAGPRMVIVEPVFDAGKVDQGTTVVHDFIVKNTGDEPLLITDVTTD